jgi:hypothetical protein
MHLFVVPRVGDFVHWVHKVDGRYVATVGHVVDGAVSDPVKVALSNGERPWIHRCELCLTVFEASVTCYHLNADESEAGVQ